MKQYEIWLAELPPPVGHRPVLLLTRSAAYDYLNTVIVAEVTTTIRGIPQEVPLGELEGVAPSVANFDNVHVVAKHLLRARAGAVPASRELEVKRALGYALGWPELKAL
jgi:mRNA interferase MazF